MKLNFAIFFMILCVASLGKATSGSDCDDLNIPTNIKKTKKWRKCNEHNKVVLNCMENDYSVCVVSNDSSVKTLAHYSTHNNKCNS